MDWVMWMLVRVVAVLAIFVSGQVGATAQALDNAAATISFRRSGQAEAVAEAQTQHQPASNVGSGLLLASGKTRTLDPTYAAPAPMARAANDTTAAGAPPSGGGNGPGNGGPGGPGNGGSGGPGNGGPGGPGKSGPFSHEPPAGHAKTMSAVLGEIVWLMSQSPLHKQFFISDLEWFVMTPALLQQFRTFYATDRPIGVVLWAMVSDEVAARLSEGTTKLRPQDWKSGDKLWVVEVIAPFGGAEEMVKDLKANVFPSREVHYLAVNKDGKQVRVL